MPAKNSHPNPQTILLIARAHLFGERTAIVDNAETATYDALLASSHRVASSLLHETDDLREARVAFIVKPGVNYVAAQWAIWRAGGIAVPLAVTHPASELAFVIDDSQASIVIADEHYEELVRPLAEDRRIRFVRLTDALTAEPAELPIVDPLRRAMMLYTSGTTSRPKGVVTTHENIAAQIQSLVEAWQWSPDDRILHCLPLHHIHGIINVLCCAMWSGAACVMLPKFDAAEVWRRIANSRELTLFMAVPTIYAKLIAAWKEAPPDKQEQMSAGCRRLRLMVSGSAALPVSTLEKWRTISGHTLLERYGMTEIGMALSNPHDGPRLPRCVGSPLPRVEVRLVTDNGQLAADGVPGEIQVKGPTVFKEYWNRPEATRAAFTDDGWFKTGDIASREHGVYRIIGRDSVDIIKTGGYKVSALEVEEVLRTHEAIDQCAVVGVEDPEWGQRVCAAVVLSPSHDLDLESLRTWCKERLALYKIPSRLLLVDDLPRNAMGKVTKPEIATLFDN